MINIYEAYLDDNNLPYLKVENSIQGKLCSNADDVCNIINTAFNACNKAEEHLYMLSLGGSNVVLGLFEISKGTRDFSCFSPKEILYRALLSGACSIILAHNHPSGVLTPSKEDKKCTTDLNISAKLMGISLLDHVIIGKHDYCSFKEKGLL